MSAPNIDRVEHYEAQGKFGELLGEAISTPLFRHPVKRWQVFTAAFKLKDSHKKCCDWANENE